MWGVRGSRGCARVVLGLALLGLSSGCVTVPPEEFFQLSPESPKNRAMQTRMFESSDEKELLSASAATLQDLGFEIEESVWDVGFLRAAKERSAREWGQHIGRFLVAILTSPLAIIESGPVILPIDLHQKIAATLVTRPLNPERSRHEVRIMFYRVVWKGDGAAGRQSFPPGEQRSEMIRDAVLYQQFFAKLAKATFLEAHKI
jgi:hypothetical protein